MTSWYVLGRTIRFAIAGLIVMGVGHLVGWQYPVRDWSGLVFGFGCGAFAIRSEFVRKTDK